MPKKKSYITGTDQFCGAGGSSQGAFDAGVEVVMALNHWKLAIETHNTNFPNTNHDCTDISACDPRRYPSTDLLITSPECTNHSLAKGKKIAKKQMDLFSTGTLDASAERSRATMWDVCRFAEYHQYNAIIVENVVDARKWVMWDAWISAMSLLGYNYKCVYLNSQHAHPTPQSRDRMYVVFWKRGNKAPMLDYMPLAHCPKCGKDVNAVQTWKDRRKNYGKYKQQYVYCCPYDSTIVEPYYYAAFNCIDWTNIGTRIGDRERPLSTNTVRRINYGLKKYSQQPIIVNDQHSTGIDFRVKGVTEQLSTIPTAHGLRLVTPPFITLNEHTKVAPQVKNIAETIQTQATRQTMALVTPPFIVELKKSSNTRSIESPLGCCTTVGYHGLVTNEKLKSFISYYYSSLQASTATDALGTVTCVDTHGLVSYDQPAIEDCYYRMLMPKEVKLAMAFNEDYIVLGNGKEQVKQLGNAVTPPAMRWLVNQVVESLN